MLVVLKTTLVHRTMCNGKRGQSTNNHHFSHFYWLCNLFATGTCIYIYTGMCTVGCGESGRKGFSNHKCGHRHHVEVADLEFLIFFFWCVGTCGSTKRNGFCMQAFWVVLHVVKGLYIHHHHSPPHKNIINMT